MMIVKRKIDIKKGVSVMGVDWNTAYNPTVKKMMR